MNIREILNNRNTRICLFGEIEEVLPVAEMVHEFFNDITYVTVYGEEVRLQSLNKFGIPSVLYNVDTAGNYGYVVVCAKYNFKRLTRLLICAGMKEYEDYVSSRTLDAFIHQKKLLVSMGGELNEQLFGALSVCKSFTDSYSITYFPLREFWRDTREEYIHISRMADFHIESVTNNANFKLCRLPEGILKNDCVSIKIPDFNFKGLFPQIYQNVELFNSLLLRLYDRDDSMDYETVFASKIDLFVEYLCESANDYSEKSVMAIADKLLDEDLIDSDLIKAYYLYECERWKKLEEANKIDLGIREIFDFEIESNCINRNVFEWSDAAVIKLLRYILDKAGLSGELIPEQDVHLKLEEMCGTELPIYPCVQKAFGLEKQLKNKLYKIVTFKQVKYLNISEYAEYISEYSLKSLELIRFTETDKKLIHDWTDRNDYLGGYYIRKKRVTCIEDWVKQNMIE